MLSPAPITALQPNVDRIELPGKTVYLIGTAHLSKESVNLVRSMIDEVRPDCVAVELCESRYQSLRQPDRWRNMDIIAVIRGGKAYVLMAQLMLSGFQRKLGEKLDIKPGAEMLAALTRAEELGCAVTLADRDIRVTLKRSWASIGLWTSVKLIASIVLALFSKQEVSQEEIERLKSSDALESLMKEFSAKLPHVRTALIDERDRYLAAKIAAAPGARVVAVVGAGHVPGIRSIIGQPLDLAPLEIIPRPSPLRTVFAWSIPLLVIGAFVYGFLHSGSSASFEMIGAWFWITGFFGALGAALALSHPLTILSAFFGSPFATLNPFIAAGWISGLVEAMIRKPRVSDLENIALDMSSLRGIWRNRVSRILLVIGFTNLGATVGMIWGVKVIAGLMV